MNIVTSTNILYERTAGKTISTEISMDLCSQAGFGELDLCFVDLVSQSSGFCGGHWKEYLNSLAERSNRLGVQFVQAHAPIHDFCRKQEDDDKIKNLVKRSIEGAGMLGIPWIVIHPSTGVEAGVQSPDTHEKNVKYFQEMADYAQNYNVGIAVENMWGQTREGVSRYGISAEILLQLLDDIDRKNVGACWDTEHASIEGVDQEAGICLLGDKIKATHISDQTAHNNIHILPYTGFTDWDTVLGAFAKISYEGVFAFEIQHYLLSMPWDLIPLALKFSRQVGESMIETIRGKR